MIRLERLRLTLGIMIRVLLLGAVGWVAALRWQPELALSVPIGSLVAVLVLIVAADAALFWQMSRRQVLLRMDRQLGLADGLISSVEVGGEVPVAWQSRQLQQTLEALEARHWGQLWPARWPRFTGAATVALAVLSGVLWLSYFTASSQARPVASAYLQSQMEGIEQVFKDWDEAQKTVDDPELKRMLEELKPLREKMAAGQMQEKEAVMALSRVEEKLEEARRNLAAKSLETAAGELASALEPLQNMSALSAALRRKDFEQAEKLSAEQAAALARAGAKLPQGAEDAANQQRLSNLAKTLQERGQQAASQALQRLLEGMKKGDCEGMCQGLGSLSQCFGSQAKRDAEKKRLNTQLAQLGQCKECMGNGKSICSGMSLMPKLALFKQPGGKGAGSTIDPNRFGAETQLAANRIEGKLTGTLDAGDSETTTEKSDDPQREVTSGARVPNFRQYEKLSREAIEDENIPLAHRQTIRKYFEMIRPAAK